MSDFNFNFHRILLTIFVEQLTINVYERRRQPPKKVSYFKNFNHGSMNDLIH